MVVRENSDELKLRAEEVETPKALVNVDHVEEERWCPLLVDADWCAFCQALYKGIEGEDWEELYVSYKEMSMAVGVKKPQEVQKKQKPWKINAEEECYDTTREDNTKGRNKTR